MRHISENIAAYQYSVIIPYRNTLGLLHKAVDSIPDREDIQIIIVDNSMTTLTEEQIPQKQLAKVVYATSDPTKGAGRARNEGLKQAKGKWLLFLDADDYFTNEAFAAFDKYLSSNYEIIYFDADSIKLSDGSRSTRHETIHSYITSYLSNNKDDCLRYRFVNPVCKMVRANLVREHNIQFDETPVANDAMFSTMVGHYAKRVTADDEVVYMITEGEGGTSLTKAKSAKNQFIRFQVAIKRYKFVESVGRKDQCPRLRSFVGRAFMEFGIKEGIKWIRYAHKEGVKLF